MMGNVRRNNIFSCLKKAHYFI